MYTHYKVNVMSVILAKGSTANQITPLPSVLMKQHVDWLELFMVWSEPLCFFTIYSGSNVSSTTTSISILTLYLLLHPKQQETSGSLLMTNWPTPPLSRRPGVSR